MKKTIVFLLLTALLLTAMMPMTAVAEEPRDYAKNLVAYWDFEGDKPLNDKGFGSQKDNTLTAVGSVTYENGATVIPETAGSSLKTAMHGVDLIQTESLTLGLAVTLTNVKSGTTVLIRRTNAYQLNAVHDAASGGYKLQWINDALPNQAKCVYTISGDTTFAYGTEYYFFIAVQARKVESATSGNVNDITLSYSTDGKTFASQKTENTEHYYTNVESGYVFRSGCNKTLIQYGKISDTGANAAVIAFDDLWYFNTAVSADSLSTIVCNKINYATDNSAAEVPAYRGVQISPVADQAFSVRLVATVDSLSYAEVGFEVKVTDYKGAEGTTAKIYGTDAVYKSISGKDADSVGGSVVYTAADLGGEYIYALAINKIPTDAPVTFSVTTYYKVTAEGERILGATYTVTVENGRLVSQAVVASEA